MDCALSDQADDPPHADHDPHRQKEASPTGPVWPFDTFRSLATGLLPHGQAVPSHHRQTDGHHHLRQQRVQTEDVHHAGYRTTGLTKLSDPTLTVMASQGSRKAVLAALAANSCIAVAKFVAAAITGSAAMLAEGIHSVADSSNQGILLWGMAVSRKQGGSDHPFGRGKEVYFWSFVVAVMLFVGGAVFSIHHGIDTLRNPHAIGNFALSVTVLSGALLFEFVSLVVAMREFNSKQGSRSMWRSIRETKDAVLLVILFEDSAAVAGLLVALGGVIASEVTGDPRWDAMASIVIGVLLAGVAFFLAFEIKGLLIGEAASRRDRATINARVLAHSNVAQVGRLLTMHMGPDEILVNLDVELVADLSGEEVHQTIEDVEQAFRSSLPAAKNIFIETKGEE